VSEPSALACPDPCTNVIIAIGTKVKTRKQKRGKGRKITIVGKNQNSC